MKPLTDNGQVIVGDMGRFLALTKARAAYVAWSADGGKGKPAGYFRLKNPRGEERMVIPCCGN